MDWIRVVLVAGLAREPRTIILRMITTTTRMTIIIIPIPIFHTMLMNENFQDYTFPIVSAGLYFSTGYYGNYLDVWQWE